MVLTPAPARATDFNVFTIGYACISKDRNMIASGSLKLPATWYMSRGRRASPAAEMLLSVRILIMLFR